MLSIVPLTLEAAESKALVFAPNVTNRLATSANVVISLILLFQRVLDSRALKWRFLFPVEAMYLQYVVLLHMSLQCDVAIRPTLQ